MAQILRGACHDDCGGCPALPMTPEQYQNVLNLKHTGNPRDVAYSERFLRMELIAVWCDANKEIKVFQVQK